LFGGFVNLCKGKTKVVINKIASVLIFILSLLMIERALVGFGIDIKIESNEYSEYQKAIIKDDYQYVEFDLDYGNFKDIIVQKDIAMVEMIS